MIISAKVLTIVFAVKLLHAVINPPAPNDYLSCEGLDEMYRLIHRGFCYYIAGNETKLPQKKAKANLCGRKGRLALPNDYPIKAFIRKRLYALKQLVPVDDDHWLKDSVKWLSGKAWIGLEQFPGQSSPDGGWYFEDGNGHKSIVSTEIFFFAGEDAVCRYPLPDGCVEEFVYHDQTYKGCTRVDDGLCWCSTTEVYNETLGRAAYEYCSSGTEEVTLGAECKTGLMDCYHPRNDFFGEALCAETIFGETAERIYGCYVPRHGPSDGLDGVEDNEFQISLITENGNILEAAEGHEYHFAVCQYKDTRGALLRYKKSGARIVNAVSVNLTAIDVLENCAIHCYRHWVCAAFSYSETKKICLLHSIPLTHWKAKMVVDKEFGIWER